MTVLGLHRCAGFFLVVVSGDYLLSSWDAWASHCGGLSCCKAQVLGAQASAFAARGLSNCSLCVLEHWLSRCGLLAELLHGIWDLPRSRIEPLCPALVGVFLNSELPEKPNVEIIKIYTSDQDSSLRILDHKKAKLTELLIKLKKTAMKESHGEIALKLKKGKHLLHISLNFIGKNLEFLIWDAHYDCSVLMTV